MAYVVGVDLGTLKWMPTHVYVLTNYDIAATPYVVNLTTYVPAGTRAVYIRLGGVSSQAADGLTVREHDGADDKWGVRTVVANQWNEANGIIRLNATYEFDMCCTSAARTSGVYLVLLGYFM